MASIPHRRSLFNKTTARDCYSGQMWPTSPGPGPLAQLQHGSRTGSLNSDAPRERMIPILRPFVNPGQDPFQVGPIHHSGALYGTPLRQHPRGTR